MNREHWKRMLPFVTAFANGENVETFSLDEWEARDEYHFDSSPDAYRIVHATKLRPWTREELEDRMLRGAVLVRSVNDSVSQIIQIDCDGKCRVGCLGWTPAELLEEWKLIGIDGARLPEPEPCGVRE